MKSEVSKRVLNVAWFFVKNQCTVREIAKIFKISKSTAHNDLAKRLKKINVDLYLQCKEILNKNFKEKHIRGGIATKKVFLILKNK